MKMSSEERKSYHVWTDNVIIKNYLSKQDNKSEAIESILEKYLTGKLVEKTSVLETSQPNKSETRERLKDAKLTLEVWKLLKEQFPEYTMSQLVAVVNGEKQLPEPQVKEIMSMKKVCSICYHEHQEETRLCKERMCFCGVR